MVNTYATPDNQQPFDCLIVDLSDKNITKITICLLDIAKKPGKILLTFASDGMI